MMPINPMFLGNKRKSQAVGVLCLSIALLVGGARSATAEPPILTMPIACELGDDCWIVNYFDADSSKSASDYTGGIRSYDGHGGTDFAIRDLEVMKSGVKVLAAALGVVHALRDGMADINVTQTGRAAVAKRECGNGVLINHNDGWSTQYCHLRNGSVRVERGQKVAAGDVLALVGQSGLAQFPHVHLTVRNPRGQKVDPFTTPGQRQSEAATLWDRSVLAKLAYRPTDIFAVGFRDGAPDSALVKLGTIENTTISRTSPTLLFWVGMFGVHAQDRYQITLSGPDGRVLVRTEKRFPKNQARRFAWIGKRLKASEWPPGRYLGRITITHTADAGPQTFTRDQEVVIR